MGKKERTLRDEVSHLVCISMDRLAFLKSAFWGADALDIDTMELNGASVICRNIENDLSKVLDALDKMK